jgi:oxygen-independent coproporphyrinogen III oxidase
MNHDTEAPAPGDAKTTAGNYFIANYPPFSFWRPEQQSEVMAALGAAPDPATPLGVYAHIPFCRKRCHFCYFRVYTGSDAKPQRVSTYIDALLAELRLYANMPLLQDRRPRFVYFGGGTPSFLAPEQMAQLITGMQAKLPWDDVEEVTFECEPGTLTQAKLTTLYRHGVTRISLGIEHFDDEILKSNGRAHLSPEVYRAYNEARATGFAQINIDLIAGMLNETEAKWHECVGKAIELAPDCVTIYQMEIPFNTTIYREMHARGDIEAPVADWPTKRDWVDYAFREFEKAGYTVTSTCTAVKEPDAYRFLYRDYLWTGADMVSLGIASFGHFRGTHYQNEKDFGPYNEKIVAGELPIHRALVMTADERLVRELILQLKRGRIERDYFRRKFDIDAWDRFAAPITRLQASGDMVVDDHHAVLTRRSLLAVDELLPEFFLPQHRSARYT